MCVYSTSRIILRIYFFHSKHASSWNMLLCLIDSTFLNATSDERMTGTSIAVCTDITEQNWIAWCKCGAVVLCRASSLCVSLCPAGRGLWALWAHQTGHMRPPAPEPSILRTKEGGEGYWFDVSDTDALDRVCVCVCVCVCMCVWFKCSGCMCIRVWHNGVCAYMCSQLMLAWINEQ